MANVLNNTFLFSDPAPRKTAQIEVLKRPLTAAQRRDLKVFSCALLYARIIVTSILLNSNSLHLPIYNS
jgi:hypothetical protein